MLYQCKKLSTNENVGEPAELPADLQGLTDEKLADLAWAPWLEMVDTGYFPVEPEAPSEQDELDAQWALIRVQRSELLRASDWSQTVPDVPEDVKAAYLAYRQVLWTLIADTEDPFNVAWPVNPELEG